jgi:hypothetical protein
MSQGTIVMPTTGTVSGLALSQNINTALLALVSNNSGNAAPALTYPFMFWADTTTDLLKQRNAADSAWITIGTLSSVGLGLLSRAGGTLTGNLIFKTGANITAAATTVLTSVTGNMAHLTGNTGVTGWTMTADQTIELIIDGTPLFTNHATNNNLPGGANIQGAAGDRMKLYYDGTTVYCFSYIRASGKAITSDSVAYLQDLKSSGADGGNATSGAWRTRDLNTEIDADNIVTLSSNQFSLAAGGYDLLGATQAHSVNTHKSRIFNVTDSVVVVQGQNSRAGSNGTNDCATPSLLFGSFTITGTKVFELQSWVESSRNTDGWGKALNTSGSSEVYSVLQLHKRN